MIIQSSYSNTPVWKDIHVHSELPAQLRPLKEITQNLWWVWNEEVKAILETLDPDEWEKSGKNPVEMLQNLQPNITENVVNNHELMRRIQHIYDNFKNYMSIPHDKERPSVAYFSMEYGLSHVLKIYSGGLGILAGDYLKEASDSNVDMTAVGFLYRYGYFTQTLSIDGQQIANYEPQNFGSLPITQIMNPDDTPMILTVPFHDRPIYSNVWKVAVGRINLYLMDTDIEQNSDYDRSITHQLYGGDWENRMKQEYLLGIGGILLLKKLGIKKDVYHMNEGHAAFINVQRLRDYVVEEKLSFREALEVVRASSLYTVHTPVPAGHDYFDESLIAKYMTPIVQKMGIPWQQFMDMGRANPGTNEKFSMSVFALNTAQETNGVSKLHGAVSQKMFQPVWKGYFPKELHVGYVTNGVHLPSWATSSVKALYEKYFGDSFFNDQSNPEIWKKIYDVSDNELWALRMHLKKKLVDYIRIEFTEGWLKNQADPSRIMSMLEEVNPNALLIGFSRRFATYKRAHLLFTDLERLSRIVNNPKYPVQFIFAGKAHPADGGGQGLIKQIVEISRRPEFLGKIIFLENYDMRLAKRLVSGVDIWLNTPTRAQEASGTSGEKAEMNGVLNLSVLDGWWYEGYREGAGWALTEKKTYDSQSFQDELDASTIYSMLENEIIPLYYAHNSYGYSYEWIQYIKKSMAEIAPNFTTKRMMDDYYNLFYNKLAKRSHILQANNYAKAKEIVKWKEDTASKWDKFEVIKLEFNPNQKVDFNNSNKEIYGRVVIDKKDMACDFGVECVVVDHDTMTKEPQFIDSYEFELVKKEGTLLYFETSKSPNDPGTHQYGIRIFPKNPYLPHRMDFAYMRWI
ncbi:alpha-glucan family phosphorylase [Proteiniphilum sp. UBA5310]|jgi:starch phosphorylase|uniref:alpha-glucan family phosphorylase n=1 Tax=Proteiniphilum sp. UBA5310 TaxID=1947275 RepID=UPI00258090CC|nr:alpha-glucan family phosphorylase [Proteiniphilum sp. UBA5310]